MNKTVIVIGGGLGGLNAAVSLAREGFTVRLFEKNDKLGGKLNLHTEKGFTFDLGPSILTMPQVYERLFQKAGRRMKDYVKIEPVTPHWRNFFEDHTHFDFDPDKQKMQAELDKLGAGTEGFWEFLEYSRKQLSLSEKGYFNKGYDTFWELLKGYGALGALKFDNFHTMHGGVKKYISNPHLTDALDYFVKYVGSSPYDAPGMLNLMPSLQFDYGLWYVTGGMYNMARGLEKLARELGVEIHTNREVLEIKTIGRNITGVRLADGETIPAGYVVSNMEVIPAYKRLLKEEPEFIKTMDRFEPACSGLVLHLGIEGEYPQLAHHNFFHSADPAAHFNSVFHKKELSKDPTIYLVAPCKSDRSLAPQGCEIIKILPHIPHLQENNPLELDDYLKFKEVVLDKLERMGLTGLRKRVMVEEMLTPIDIERMYYSNRGSIYGVVSDRTKNLAFKMPKQSIKYENLYFVGGSVNPGCGMPMVALSGQLTAEKIIQRETE